MLPPDKCANCGSDISAGISAGVISFSSFQGLVSVAWGLVIVPTNLLHHHDQEVAKF